MHAGPFGAWLAAARASLRGMGSHKDVIVVLALKVDGGPEGPQPEAS